MHSDGLDQMSVYLTFIERQNAGLLEVENVK